MTSRRNAISSIDWWLIAAYFALMVLGWLNIYSASYSETNQHLFNMSSAQGRQFIWMCISVGMALFIMFSESRLYQAFSPVFYLSVIVMLVLVLLIGQEVKGSKSWFTITSTIKFQPSELAKFATSLMLAWLIGMQDFRLWTTKYFWGTVGILLLPAGLILLQNDTGSFLVFISFGLMLFRFGLPWFVGLALIAIAGIFLGSVFWSKIWILVLVGTIALVSFLFVRKKVRNIVIILCLTGLASGMVYGSEYAYHNILRDHQKTRIRVWLGLEKDFRGSYWNVHNSKVAIGSGGWSGKGFMNGALTKLNYVPEQNTDYIFTTVGEEWGFAGSVGILGIFTFLLIRLVIAAERQRNQFAKVYGYCVFSIIFFHYFMNIGMVLGLIPTVGIPLPFFSYGGSSLMGFSLLLWVFIKLDSVNMERF